MISTSYFGNHRAISAAGFKLVRVAAYHPRFLPASLVVANLPALAPSKDLLARAKAGDVDEDGYRTEYLAQLEATGADAISGQLAALEAAHGSIALCCFESLKSEGEWCHRTMFAEWFKQRTGRVIPEL